MILRTNRLNPSAFTLVEVMVAVAILMVCMVSVLLLVNQSLKLVKEMQKQRPDLGALAGKTLMDPVQPNEESPSINVLEIGTVQPFDEDFELNQGGGEGRQSIEILIGREISRRSSSTGRRRS